MTSQDKRQPAFTDTDRLWFGKYKDELLQDVPASYLLWWYNENPMYKNVKYNGERYPDKNLMLWNYIWNSMDAIKMETEGK